MEIPLNKDELQSLLENLSRQEPPSNGVSSHSKEVVPCNLGSEEKIIRGKLPGLDLVYGRFARTWREELQKVLGRSVSISAGQTELVKFGALLKRLSLPSSLHILRSPELSSQALLIVSTPLVFALVETLLGGKPRKLTNQGREFTSIEMRLVSKVVLNAVDSLKEAWSPLCHLDFIYVRSETSPLAISIAHPGETAAVTPIDIQLDESIGTLLFCLPYSAIEPLKKSLSSGFQGECGNQSARSCERMLQHVNQISANIRVELARGAITGRKLLELKLGDTLLLETAADREAVVFVEGSPKFSGTVGDKNGNKALKIKGKIDR